MIERSIQADIKPRPMVAVQCCWRKRACLHVERASFRDQRSRLCIDFLVFTPSWLLGKIRPSRLIGMHAIAVKDAPPR